MDNPLGMEKDCVGLVGMDKYELYSDNVYLGEMWTNTESLAHEEARDRARRRGDNPKEAYALLVDVKL